MVSATKQSQLATKEHEAALDAWTKRDKEQVKAAEGLEKDVRKALRPNDWVRVDVGRRHDDKYFVFAEYKPSLSDPGTIEDTMMKSYKAIYTSTLPVIRAEIVAYGDLVNQYGHTSENVIYRTLMDGERGALVNWEKLYLVTPIRVFNDYWQHPAIR